MNDKILKHLKVLLIMVFILIPLGASVRAMNAGLACPDWPLCFGDIIPDYHPQVYLEFIHRALAGIVGIYFFNISYFIFKAERISSATKKVTVFAVILLIAQIIMGALTVTLHLDEYIVAGHLSMGTAFFATLVWLYTSIRYQSKVLASKKLKVFSGFAFLAVYIQIILGGLVASHYAALACTDFPLCHGQWIPTLSGVTGLHVIHRLGAYTLTVILGIYIYLLLKDKAEQWFTKFAVYIGILISVQLAIGIANVLLYRPPLITVLHLAFGTALLGVASHLYRRLN